MLPLFVIARPFSSSFRTQGPYGSSLGLSTRGRKAGVLALIPGKVHSTVGIYLRSTSITTTCMIIDPCSEEFFAEYYTF